MLTWPLIVCSFKVYHDSFAYSLLTLTNQQCVSYIYLSYALFTLYWITLNVLFYVQWSGEGVHCIQMAVESVDTSFALHHSGSWLLMAFFELQLYYNCSPRNQIMQMRSILLWAKVTSKCKISQALRDKQDRTEWVRAKEGEWVRRLCRSKLNIPSFFYHNDLVSTDYPPL